MEETPSVLMDCTGKIIRTSIHTFLKHFHYFTTIPILLLLPFSASFLLSQTIFKYYYSPFSETIHAQFDSMFDLAGSSFTSQIKSQTVFPFVFSLPFALSSFIIAKASIIQALNHHEPSFQPPFFCFIISVYKPLLLTQLCSLVMIIAINSATFSFLFISLISLQSFWLPYFSLIQPAVGAVFYSLFANTIVVSNLALVVAGMGTCKGHEAIYKACLLRKGKNSMALLLFLPTNLGLLAIEALFRFRVIRIYRLLGKISASMGLEGLLIAYLYSLLIVLDTIICCLFYKNCESNSMATGQIHRSCYDLELVQERESFDD